MNPQATEQTAKRIHESLSEAIIGAAMSVHNALKPGLYENALVIELRSSSHRVEQQKTFKVVSEDPRACPEEFQISNLKFQIIFGNRTHEQT